MYWEEKINLIKKKFSVTDFKEPYLTGIEIVEKIILKMHNATLEKYYAIEDKVQIIKDVSLLRKCTVKELHNVELPKLEKDTHFWLLLVNMPLGKSYKVYDCKYNPLKELLYYSSNVANQTFYVVDKKYKWLLFFKVDTQNNMVEIYKSRSVKKIL
jgi:hypothetical protein